MLNMILLYILGGLIFFGYIPIYGKTGGYNTYNLEYFVLLILVVNNYEKIYEKNFGKDPGKRKFNLLSLGMLLGMGIYLGAAKLIWGDVSFLDLKYLVFSWIMLIIFRSIDIERERVENYAFVMNLLSMGIIGLYIALRGNPGFSGAYLANKNPMGAILAGNSMFYLFLTRHRRTGWIMGAVGIALLVTLKNRSTVAGIGAALLFCLIENLIKDRKIRENIYFYGIVGAIVGAGIWWKVDFAGMNRISSSRLQIMVDQIGPFLRNPLMGSHFSSETAGIGVHTLHLTWLRPIYYGGILYSLFYYPFIYINGKEIFKGESVRIKALGIFAFTTGLFEIFSPFGTGTSFFFFWLYLAALLGKNLEEKVD